MKRKVKTRFHLVSEKAFTAQVIRLAQFLGWRVAHFRPAMTKRGNWVTAVQGDGAGFPDLVLVHTKKARLIFAELKSEDGQTSSEQDIWLNALSEVEYALRCSSSDVRFEVFVWRPHYIDEIEKELRR